MLFDFFFFFRQKSAYYLLAAIVNIEAELNISDILQIEFDTLDLLNSFLRSYSLEYFIHFSILRDFVNFKDQSVIKVEIEDASSTCE